MRHKGEQQGFQKVPGVFNRVERAAFTLLTQRLPTGWEFVFTNERLVMRVDQFGPIYAQFAPPADILLFRREGFQRYASWLVWLASPQFRRGPFTCFHAPAAAREPRDLRIVYSPGRASWRFTREGLRVVTELFISRELPRVYLGMTICNQRRRAVNLRILPAMRPYVNYANLAPWDRPEWYLKSGFCREAGVPGFWSCLLNPHSQPERRRTVVLWSSPHEFSSAEVRYDAFVGHGTWERPGALARGALRLTTGAADRWGVTDEQNGCVAFPPVYALAYDVTLAPQATWSLRQALEVLPCGPRGAFPGRAVARRSAYSLQAAAQKVALRWNTERERARAEQTAVLERLSLALPDRELTRYVNDWLPLQLDWLRALDRGWPSGLRGTRDAANDGMGLVMLRPEWCRKLLTTLFSCQRHDGWFPRQIAAEGRGGKHDLRNYVDAGNWVVELLYEYLCFTKDWPLLNQSLPWLDDGSSAPLLTHARAAIEYYLRQENIGEHGLCKIREGDWLDALNRAGLQGRGESVTVTCQTILGLWHIERIFEQAAACGYVSAADAVRLGRRCRRHAQKFKKALLRYALNAAGYFNSVFNDEGRWLFSPRDPDGQARIYSPANTYAIIAGVPSPDQTSVLLRHLERLKTDQGYRLFWPPFGDRPIPCSGRAASGDVPPGVWENGTVYNHGAQGFLARALAVAGRGDKLLDVLRWMLPYPQDRHPTSVVGTPPYAMVNYWLDVPGYRHRGGLQFTTGATAMALRAVYAWMLGIRFHPRGVIVDPCMPSAWTRAEASLSYRGCRLVVRVLNPQGRESGVRMVNLNGRPISRFETDPFSGRAAPLIEDTELSRGDNSIIVSL